MSVTKRIIIPAFIFLLVFSIVSRVFFRDFQNGWEAYQNKDYKTAFELWQPLAEKGDTRAQFFLGFMNDMGFGVPKDDKEAVNWYRLAAEQGDSRAQLFLGFMYDLGKGVPQDYKEAIKWYRLATEQGYHEAAEHLSKLEKIKIPKELEGLFADANRGVAKAQYNLAMKYANKEGGFHNEKEAAKWFELAAKQGFKAKKNIYELANKNVSKALEILKSDAENGIPEAQYTLSVMYGNGDGVPQDIKKSIMWCQLAAEQGYAMAQFNLAVLYSTGQGVPEDKQKALKWYQLALKQGYNETRDILYNWARNNNPQALKLLIDDAENDIIEAQINLAVMYLTGQGVPEDKQKALKWYKTAAETKIHTKKIVKTNFRKKNIPQVLKRLVYNAEKGAVDAQINLALMYASGEIVPEDTNKALKWFQRSLKLKIESENKYLQNGE
ncbi:MAG: sel1 repeat family protein [Nitrospinae bacterium]|nr:sel1 repeat family protein [Nitrospinota bacterium]